MVIDSLVPVAEVYATVLISLPVLAFWIARYARGALLWEYALDIPLANATDMLGILLLSRFVTLESAILFTRPIWVVVAGASVWPRRKGDSWSLRLELDNLRAPFFAGIAGVSAFFLSMSISRNFAVADRGLHTPLVPSIAGQKLPFEHVYGGPLHYHISGDVFAAMLRTLSFDVISSNLALSLAHDLLFAMIAVMVALLLMSFGATRFWHVLLGALALLLHGPIPLRGGLGGSVEGYSYFRFLVLSYRPHYPLAMLLLIGIFGVLAVRAESPWECNWQRVLATLLGCTTLLAITDESSVMLVGPALAVTWLVNPALFGLNRGWGAVTMIALVLSTIGANLLFNGSLAPGGPAQTLSWLPNAQVPGLQSASLALSSDQGKLAFAFDLLPAAACLFSLALIALDEDHRRIWGLLCLSAVILAICAILVLHLRLNGEMRGPELHRLYVAPFIAALLYALLYLPRMAPGSLTKCAALLGLAVPAVYSVQWLRESADALFAIYRENEAGEWAKESSARLDCRLAAGAHFGERPRLTYVAPHEQYLFTSCRPIFGPGRMQTWATLKTLPQADSIPQLRALDAELAQSGASLDAVCPHQALPSDPVCSYALDHGRTECSREGTRFLRCPLTLADRAAILKGR